MKRRVVAILLQALVSLALQGQEIPTWLDADFREMQYPASTFYTGFAYGELPQGQSLHEMIQRMQTEAQADLSKKIRMQISSRSQTDLSAASSGGQYRESESFVSRSATESSVEITGVKTESYHDAKNRLVYAFASVNRFELTGYCKSSLAMHLAQIEGLLQTATGMETGGEKAKARKECEAAAQLLVKVRTAQDLLMAVAPAGITADDLQQTKTETLHSRLAQMQAQLAQAVHVYMSCNESNLTQPVMLIGSKLKSTLAGKGCSFTDAPEQADFRMQIVATTRRYGNSHDFAVCYADVQIALFDVRKNKTVFQDAISTKGIGTTDENAGRKALEEAVPAIVQKISTWIEN